MTKALDAIFEKVSRLPEARQDDIAGVLERLVEMDDASSPLSIDDWAEIDRRLASPPRYASDAEVEAFFRSALA